MKVCVAAQFPFSTRLATEPSPRFPAHAWFHSRVELGLLFSPSRDSFQDSAVQCCDTTRIATMSAPGYVPSARVLHALLTRRHVRAVD